MDIALILSQRYEGAQWSLNGDNYSGLTWLSDSPKPTLEELGRSDIPDFHRPIIARRSEEPT